MIVGMEVTRGVVALKTMPTNKHRIFAPKSSYSLNMSSKTNSVSLLLLKHNHRSSFTPNLRRPLYLTRASSGSNNSDESHSPENVPNPNKKKSWWWAPNPDKDPNNKAWWVLFFEGIRKGMFGVSTPDPFPVWFGTLIGKMEILLFFGCLSIFFSKILEEAFKNLFANLVENKQVPEIFRPVKTAAEKAAEDSLNLAVSASQTSAASALIAVQAAKNSAATATLLAKAVAATTTHPPSWGRSAVSMLFLSAYIVFISWLFK